MAPSRRTFFGRIVSSGAVLATRPAWLFSTSQSSVTDDAGLPQPPDGELSAEFWRELRKEFLIPGDEAFFNTGTLGASPRIVREAVIDHMNHVDRDIAHWDYKADHEQYFTGYAQELWVREKLARLINAQASEVALTQNATFGLNFIANGLDLGLGAEVIVQDNAHPRGRCGWQLRDKRYGANVKMIHLPAAPRDPASIIKAYEDATTPQTRVWTIARLTSSDAIVFPVNELCRRARERGIYSIV